ncbi:conserved protein of unknown function [Tepidanaerobacter acetatoxydans Re1]|uniref:Uncharacterized protein n=1 Tax=Tepidanaerobacter acetatoxydans (strain DSM 21804 / JCM 16047 / Re1) TaxID=1209989 RepID=L0RZF8_TEPAE|nr:hypothetical protein [Tepidanaerobacter acetatoxydans]CCP25594.1 conserved protein of unknown function [Tepidanaerobacter acetatoxydans Re1]
MDYFSEETMLISHCEDLIKKIKDIVSAKIITGPDGKIAEIHVISKTGRSPKQIARDVESTLIAFLGSEIDHKKISIAQINDEKNVMQPRLKISKIATSKTRNNLEVKVLLADPEGKILEGSATGLTSLQNRMRTTACAALNAVRLFLAEDFALSLDDVYTYRIGNYQAVSVLLFLSMDEKEEYLLGSALIKHDIYEAVAAAVLGAVNRRIGLLI